MNRITPRTLKGFRDFLPAQALRRARMLARIRTVFEQAGFTPFETPALEYADVLTGKYGDEGEKLLYRFRDQGGRDVALRYDLTVPLARVVAQYGELPLPCKRYQMAQVWRAENTQKGRFREFTQCDVDIVGSADVLADAEVILCLERALRALGLTNLVVKINSRKLLDGLLEAAGAPADERVQLLRALDKIEKVGAADVQAALQSAKLTTDVGRLFALLGEGEADWEQWAAQTTPVVRKTERGAAGLAELSALAALLDARATGTTVFMVDRLLARGLDYYTGTLFEITLGDQSSFGSVAGGGRYDTLIGRFTGKDLPAVGGSLGIDRTLAAMEDAGNGGERASAAQLLLTMLLDDRAELLALADEMRDAGISVDLYPEPAKLDKQLKYADKLGIPAAAILGPQEQQAGMVTLKDLRTRKQQTVPRAAFIPAVQRLLQG